MKKRNESLKLSRILAHVCIFCGGKIADYKSLCNSCMDKARERNRKRQGSKKRYRIRVPNGD